MRQIGIIFVPIAIYIFFFSIFREDISKNISINNREIASKYCPYGTNNQRCIRPSFAINCFLPGERSQFYQNCCSGESINNYCVGNKKVPSENGVLCFSNNECRSKNCQNNTCLGSPLSLAVNGFFCRFNQECASSNCVQGICVGSSQNRSKSGEICYSNDECLSNNCFQGQCTGNIIGEICLYNTECLTGTCSLINHRCIGSSTLKANFGEFCDDTEQCRLGFCIKNKCTGGRNKSSVGEVCQFSSDCLSGLCFENLCLGSQYDFAKIGQFCTSNLQCESSNCENNYCLK